MADLMRRINIQSLTKVWPNFRFRDFYSFIFSDMRIWSTKITPISFSNWSFWTSSILIGCWHLWMTKTNGKKYFISPGHYFPGESPFFAQHVRKGIPKTRSHFSIESPHNYSPTFLSAPKCVFERNFKLIFHEHLGPNTLDIGSISCFFQDWIIWRDCVVF